MKYIVLHNKLGESPAVYSIEECDSFESANAGACVDQSGEPNGSDWECLGVFCGPISGPITEEPKPSATEIELLEARFVPVRGLTDYESWNERVE